MVTSHNSSNLISHCTIIYLFICLFVCLFICLFVCLFVINGSYKVILSSCTNSKVTGCPEHDSDIFNPCYRIRDNILISLHSSNYPHIN